MGASQSTVTVGNMDAGPAQVLFNGVDLGGTSGGVKIKWKYEKKPIKADQTGNTNLDFVVVGMQCSVETMFQETRNKTNFGLVLPMATLITTSGAHQYLQFGDQTSVRQLASAAPLELHPLEEALSSSDFNWYFYKALPFEDTEYTFGLEQAKVKIHWEILLDLTTTPYRMFRSGNHAL